MCTHGSNWKLTIQYFEKEFIQVQMYRFGLNSILTLRPLSICRQKISYFYDGPHYKTFFLVQWYLLCLIFLTNDETIHFQ